ncbi:MAG: helix-turn-helix transcriptional regulator [bacterium]|nr:helix-turn-helix transcriptional regulator [bacterium]
MSDLEKQIENLDLDKKIKDLRKKNKWSQQKLAEKSGLAYNTVTKIEQGAAIHPTIQTVIKLAGAFEVSVDELIVKKTKKKS